MWSVYGREGGLSCFRGRRGLHKRKAMAEQDTGGLFSMCSLQECHISQAQNSENLKERCLKVCFVGNIVNRYSIVLGGCV